jgi:hypothetical protein
LLTSNIEQTKINSLADYFKYKIVDKYNPKANNEYISYRQIINLFIELIKIYRSSQKSAVPASPATSDGSLPQPTIIPVPLHTGSQSSQTDARVKHVVHEENAGAELNPFAEKKQGGPITPAIGMANAYNALDEDDLTNENLNIIEDLTAPEVNLMQGKKIKKEKRDVGIIPTQVGPNLRQFTPESIFKKEVERKKERREEMESNKNLHSLSRIKTKKIQKSFAPVRPSNYRTMKKSSMNNSKFVEFKNSNIKPTTKERLAELLKNEGNDNLKFRTAAERIKYNPSLNNSNNSSLPENITHLLKEKNNEQPTTISTNNLLNRVSRKGRQLRLNGTNVKLGTEIEEKPAWTALLNNSNNNNIDFSKKTSRTGFNLPLNITSKKNSLVKKPVEKPKLNVKTARQQIFSPTTSKNYNAFENEE